MSMNTMIMGFVNFLLQIICALGALVAMLRQNGSKGAPNATIVGIIIVIFSWFCSCN